MKCPVCKEKSLVIAERQGIEIDYCPECRGVWLDRGELDKIIDRAAAAPAMPTRPRDDRDERERGSFRDHDDDDDDRRDQYGRKKKRGFLGDLFEFD